MYTLNMEAAMNKRSKGLDAFTVEYLALDETKAFEIFAPNLKQALIQAHTRLQKDFGWGFVVINVLPKD